MFKSVQQLAATAALTGAACAALGVSAAAQADRPPFRVLAHWSFDEADGDQATVRDTGPHRLHGVLRSEGGAALTRVPGVRGEALRFPRTHQSWVHLDKTDYLKVPPPFTIAVWVKVGDSPREPMEVFSRKNDSWHRGYRLSISRRRITYEYGDGERTLRVRATAPPLSSDHWSMVACVHDGRTIRLYVDAEMIAEERAQPRWARADTVTAIGNYRYKKNQYQYSGDMDELMILRQALSPRQLVDLGLWTLGER